MRCAFFFLIAVILLLIGVVSAQNVEYVAATLWAGANDVKVVGNYAYCAFVNGLVIIDVSIPSSPTFVSQFYIQGNGLGIFVSGNYAYLADGSSGLQVI